MLLPEILLLDLDNTVYDYKSAHSSGMQALLDFLSAQLNLSKSQIEVGLDDSRINVKKRIGENIASSHSRLLYISDFIRSTQLQSRPSLVMEAEQIYWGSYFSKMQLFEGVLDFLTLLRFNSTKIYVVTDFTLKRQLKKIIWLGLDSLVDAVISSEDVGSDKVVGKTNDVLDGFFPEIKLASPQTIWSMGDSDSDYLLPDKSIFFKKCPQGRLRRQGDCLYRFGDFKSLIEIIQKD
jgi:putative hydrolase of the HAD superfamily